MNTLKSVVVASLIALASVNVYAWGEREQGVLQGLAGAWLLNRMLQNTEQQQPPPVTVAPPPPVYVYPSPPPQVYYRQPMCYNVPYYDQFGRLAYYRQICR